jgi:hypothetical protein
MTQRLSEQMGMPDVPNFDFTDALSEVWFQISYAAYHFAYVRVYSQSASLQTSVETLREESQAIRNDAQVDLTICRTHVAAFFWQLEHLFEALRTAIKRGKSEQPEIQYFWSYEKLLEKIEQTDIRTEIRDYRNMSHQIPAIIGIKWNAPDNFSHLFLPAISGHTNREDVDITTRLQEYFEFAANVWLNFAPSELKEKFPRDFTFPVTVPHLFLGDLPTELRTVPQLQVTVQSYNK